MLLDCIMDYGGGRGGGGGGGVCMFVCVYYI